MILLQGLRLVLVGVPVVLMMVAMAACPIPARRAAAVDPAEILRES